MKAAQLQSSALLTFHKHTYTFGAMEKEYGEENKKLSYLGPARDHSLVSSHSQLSAAVVVDVVVT